MKPTLIECILVNAGAILALIAMGFGIYVCLTERKGDRK